MSSLSKKISPANHNKYNLFENVSEYLNRYDLDGFFMPKTDAHRLEYCADKDNLMYYFTDFSGSTGACGFMTHSRRGAVFVDGRYTLQAKNEVDHSHFDVIDYTSKHIAKWFKSNNQHENAKLIRIGFDPYLLSLNEFERYQKQFDSHDLELVVMDQNPVLENWQNRPEQTIFHLSAHDEKYSGVSYAHKLSLIRDQMQNDKADYFLLNFPESICWLFNIRAKDCDFSPVAPLYALIHKNKPSTIFCHENQMSDLSKIFGDEVISEPYESLFLDMNRFQTENVTLDPHCATVKMKIYVKAAGGEVLSTRDYCDIPRACKNSVEQRGARQAHIRDGAAVCNLLAWLDTKIHSNSITELDVVNQLEAFRQQQPLYQGKSFDTISGSGPNGAIVHYRVSPESNRTLLKNDIFLLDSGGQYLDGTTDVTRTVSLNQSPTPEQKDRYTRVLKGHIALSRLKFPLQTTGSQIDVIARQYLWEIGKNYAHGTGHGVGSYLGVHEGPQRISQALNSTPLLPGMIVSNEPGYYETNEYGIRIENLELVQKHQRESEDSDDHLDMLCFETLTLIPIDTSLISIELLSNDEIQWLNMYHEKVRDTLRDLVLPETKIWLNTATKPL